MKTASRIVRGIVGSVTAIALLASPMIASADTAAVITKQVLPPSTQSSCAPLFVSSVTPYIYNDGELDSFDVVLSDPSYVGVVGVAGDVSIPFNYMSRRILPNGQLALHVDTTAQINGKLPVTITLLSAPTNGPVCLSTVSFTTDSKGIIQGSSPVSAPTSGGTVAGASTSTDNGVPGVSVSTGGTHTTSDHTGTTGSTNKSGKTGKTATGTTGSTTSTSTSIGQIVAKMCTKSGSYQLWFILLAIFFVIAAFVGLSEPPIAARHGALPLVLIGIPLIGLLIFWYYATDCRLSYFVPIILLVAAAIGLYSAYRTSPVMRPVIDAPAGERKVEEKK